MEALNNVEQSYQKLLMAQSNSKQQPSSGKVNTSFSVSVSFWINFLRYKYVLLLSEYRGLQKKLKRFKLLSPLLASYL